MKHAKLTFVKPSRFHCNISKRIITLRVTHLANCPNPLENGAKLLNALLQLIRHFFNEPKQNRFSGTPDAWNDTSSSDPEKAKFFSAVIETEVFKGWIRLAAGKWAY